MPHTFANGHVFAAAQKEWITLEHCELIANKGNDGDSFHILANDVEYLVRLYLVDAPETDSLGPARLIEQAQYFGISVPQVIEIGEKAKLFVQAKLAEPFTVVTRKASGLGRSKIERFYAFVQTKDGDLGEQLVANGLARIHGTHSAPPGVSSVAEEIEKLEQLEQQAKQAKLGGWGVSGGTAATAAPKASDQSVVGQGRRSPDRTVSPSPAIATALKPPTPIATPPREKMATAPETPAFSAATAESEKLDINTATKEQLEKVPGIGPRLAERIIAARPFKSADDLKKVNGFGGTKRYEEVRPFFR